MLNLEKARRKDAQAAWEIRNAAILNQCTGHYSINDLKIWTSGELSEEFMDAVEKYFYVAILNKQVVGTGTIDIETGKIDGIFVHPQYMRNGIGKTMVKFLEGIALNHGLRTLTLESTLNAAPFYRACGFKRTESRTYVSPKGVALDCISMFKIISPGNC